MVSSQQPITSVARSCSNYQVTNSHGSMGHQYTSGGHVTQYGSHVAPQHAPHAPQQTIQNGYNTAKHEQVSVPQNPQGSTALKRTHSLESNDSAVIHNGQNRPSVSRHRPSSARPYDYGNSRPSVDPKTGAVTMPNKHHQDAVSQEWGDDVLVGDFTTPDSCEPEPKLSSNNRKNSWGNNAEEDSYDSYISRKTVQNVLNIQKNRSGPKPSGTSGSIGGIKSAPMHGSNSSLEDQKQQKAWLHNQALMRDLKVDIPGDNISLGSHKDSGYRSGGSSGDRNSASSNSSVSFDSPTADSFRGFPGIHRSIGQTYNCSSHSSSESLSSNQSGQTVKTIQGNHRLSLIPENNCPSVSSNSSSTMTVKSQESLVSSQETLDGYLSDRHQDNTRSKPDHRSHRQQLPSQQQLQQQQPQQPQQPMHHNAKFNSGHDAECERLFLQAEALMESSNKQEENSDIHSSLAYCNQAITCLQKALTIQGASNDTIVRVRMKHNSCVLRSRRLHKSILERQQSSSSTQSIESDNSHTSRSSEDSNRYSTTSSDSGIHPNRTRRRSDKPMIDLEDRPKQEHEILKEKVKEMYHHQPVQNGSGFKSNQGYPQQHSVKQVAVSGVVQSRPIPGVTMGTCSIPKSATDSGLSQYGSQTRRIESSVPQMLSRSRNNSMSNDLDSRDSLDPSDARNVEIYGTLPKRKGKSAKPIAAAVPVPPKENVQVYQSYLERQKSAAAASSVQSGSQKMDDSRAALINHSRQWSKDEIRDLLLKDYVNKSSEPKPKTETISSTTPPTTNPSPGLARRRRNSYDPLDSRVRNKGNVAHSRQNSYEDVLVEKMAAPHMSIQDLPPKQKHIPQPAVAALPQNRLKESHYDYLPCRKDQNHSSILPPQSHNSPSKPKHRYSEPISMPRKEIGRSFVQEALQKVEGQGMANEKIRKPSVMKNVEKFQQQGAYVKAYEIQRPGEQGKPAVVETVPIKVKPELPPKLAAKPTKPNKPGKPAKPDVPKRQNSQLSTFKGDISTNPPNSSVDISSSSSTISFGNRTDNTQSHDDPRHPSADCDFPPPPDELLYPDAQSMSRCTCGASNQSPSKQNTPRQSCNDAVPVEDMMPPPPPFAHLSPPKPSMVKANSKSSHKGRKSVHFDDNIILIATPEEVNPPAIDYVAYVMNLGKKKNSAEDDDEKSDDGTIDSMDSDEILKEDSVQCTLCRKKRIEPTEIYCQGCTFYMSQFQPQES